MSALTRVVEAVDATVRAHARPRPGPDRFASVVSDPDRQFVIEAVYEGYLCHYADPRAFAGMEPDLRLLAGDELYAIGLARLAELGDTEAVAELSDLIALSARAHAQDESERVDALWNASARALSEEGGPGAAATWREIAHRA